MTDAWSQALEHTDLSSHRTRSNVTIHTEDGHTIATGELVHEDHRGLFIHLDPTPPTTKGTP